MKKLIDIQKKINVRKTERNNFGKYNYRTAEGILEALKDLLEDSLLTLSDEIILIGDRFYVKSTAKISFENDVVECFAYARESETKKGMDSAQVTGASSSYARKYALCGLFLIDDAKLDPDSKDNSKAVKKSSVKDRLLKAFGKDDMNNRKIKLIKEQLIKDSATEEERELFNSLVEKFNNSETALNSELEESYMRVL